MKKKRAFLKWAGGKFLLVDTIQRHLPEGECLIEPFVGAGSVFLNTNYSRYILADINCDLINLYNIVKNRASQFVSDAQQLFNDGSNSANVFYAHRRRFNQSSDDYEKALLFLYLNRFCFNGLCRYNLRGQFNVPFGRYLRPYFPHDELFYFAERAQNATFVCESYDVTLSKAEPGAVVYCDPPYAPLTATANFTSYHTNSFTQYEQQHLAMLATKLSAESQIPVLISNHDTPLIREWYQAAYRLIKIQARRSISSQSNGRVKVDEILAIYC